MKKASISVIVITVIAILTLTMMPLTLNADLVDTQYVNPIPDSGLLFGWALSGGVICRQVDIKTYDLFNPDYWWYEVFTEDGTGEELTVSGIGTNVVTINFGPGSMDSYAAEIKYYDAVVKHKAKAAEPAVWVRNHEFQCWQVWVNEANQFEFVFVWEYANNNHVQILDQAGNVVFYTDLPKGDCQFVADLPDGTYTVQNYHEYGHILREFVISKP